MAKIPTAEEFSKKIHPMKTYPVDWNVMIRFAKMHVEAALKEASEKATLLADGELTYFSRYVVDEGNHYSETEIDVNKESILNSYSLDNIK